MRKLVTVLALFVGLSYLSYGQKSNNTFTIYLVRHSEKVIDKNNLKDPPLTDCGQLRSEALSDFLSMVDIGKVYSTDYIRTIETAKPLAESKKLDIDLYKTSRLQAFAMDLIKDGENALVVGHSNTTSVLAGLLTNQRLELIHDSVYYLIYQVTVSGTDRTLNILKSQFNCGNLIKSN